MNQALDSFNATANRIAQTGSTPLGSPPASPPAANTGDTVSLSSDAVSLLNSRDSFEANLKTAEVSDQTNQYALNMLG